MINYVQIARELNIDGEIRNGKGDYIENGGNYIDCYIIKNDITIILCSKKTYINKKDTDKINDFYNVSATEINDVLNISLKFDYDVEYDEIKNVRFY